MYCTTANNVVSCVLKKYAESDNGIDLLYDCMCRDSKGADYASKGWPPSDTGKLYTTYSRINLADIYPK